MSCLTQEIPTAPREWPQHSFWEILGNERFSLCVSWKGTRTHAEREATAGKSWASLSHCVEWVRMERSGSVAQWVECLQSPGFQLQHCIH